LAGWAVTVLHEATEAMPAMPAGIEDRNADVWEALLSVADLAGGDWPGRARAAAVELVALAAEVEPSLGIRLLADTRAVFGDAEAMTTKSLLVGLHSVEEAPWGDLKGKPLNENGLARRLRQYSIKSKTIRIGNATAKGYTREDFYDAWQRYLTAPTQGSNGVTAVTPAAMPISCGPDVTLATAGGGSVTAKDHRNNPDKTSTVAPVTAVTAFPGDRRDNPTATNGADPLDDGLDIPDDLRVENRHRWVCPDRRPALGPVGDSLDDFR
jgi:hypothetical protein